MIGHQLHYYFVYLHLLNAVIRELCDVKLKLGYNLVLIILMLPFSLCIVSRLYFEHLYFFGLVVLFVLLKEKVYKLTCMLYFGKNFSSSRSKLSQKPNLKMAVLRITKSIEDILHR